MAQKQKNWFIVRIEGIAPVIVEYRVHAFDEDEAFDIINQRPQQAKLQSQPRIDFVRIKKLRVSIKNLLTGAANWMRRFQ